MRGKGEITVGTDRKRLFELSVLVHDVKEVMCEERVFVAGKREVVGAKMEN